MSSTRPPTEATTGMRMRKCEVEDGEAVVVRVVDEVVKERTVGTGLTGRTRSRLGAERSPLISHWYRPASDSATCWRVMRRGASVGIKRPSL